jgi:hypothetical protein
MSSREERVARNEALFREVNERIRDVSENGTTDSETEFVCECGDPECTKPVRLTFREYEDVRRNPKHFAILPGHDVADVEKIVARYDGFAVVEKTEPQAARVAVREDPRS